MESVKEIYNELIRIGAIPFGLFDDDSKYKNFIQWIYSSGILSGIAYLGGVDLMNKKTIAILLSSSFLTVTLGDMLTNFTEDLMDVDEKPKVYKKKTNRTNRRKRGSGGKTKRATAH